MNYKKLLSGAITLTTCCMLTACHMNHDWQEATCTTPRTCLTGGETEGESLGHTWVEATCSEPKHCSVCGETEGETLAHTWIDASCSAPKTCSVCGETEGTTLEHTLTEANYQQPATCSVCGETVGEPLQGFFEQEGLTCDVKLDTPYSLKVPCYRDKNYTTTANVTISDYEVFSSNDTLEALDGYEWQAVIMTITFDDENAINYGVDWSSGALDYYFGDVLADIDWGDNYTVNYNGIDYTECIQDYEVLENDWNDAGTIMTFQARVFCRAPEGYDGNVVYVGDGEDDYIYFRLN